MLSYPLDHCCFRSNKFTYRVIYSKMLQNVFLKLLFIKSLTWLNSQIDVSHFVWNNSMSKNFLHLNKIPRRSVGHVLYFLCIIDVASTVLQ